MESSKSLDKFVCPIGKQEIELLDVKYDVGGIPLLRVRIREGKRFTIFEIDQESAARWGKTLVEWSAQQAGK
jgi:hypothetical protein